VYPEPRELSTAEEVRANRRAVRQRLKSLPAWEAPAPLPTPEPKPQIVLVEPAAPAVIARPPVEPLFEIPPPKKLAVVRICAMVEQYYGLTRDEITGESRLSSRCVPRHVVFYLCTRHAGHTTTHTGRCMGNKDHSTVTTAAKRLVKKMQDNPDLAADVAAFVRRIEEWSCSASALS
jgi:hypothetical protein